MEETISKDYSRNNHNSNLWEDFDVDFGDVVPDTKDLLTRFIEREIIDVFLKNHSNNTTPSQGNLRRNWSSENIFHSLEERKEKLKKKWMEQKMKIKQKIRAPPFLRTSDKIAFTLSLSGLLMTEFILLKFPEHMIYWYTLLIFPLLATRYYFYHKIKYHYFMLDFCYYCQAMTLIWFYFFPENSTFFEVLFAATNGPLAIGIVMWRNSLVFHDLDKITSVFIHMFPPLVTFCLRWYPNKIVVCSSSSCIPSASITFGFSFVFYTIWQILYILKTEYIDREKLDKDRKIITTSRFWTEIKPHPIYLFVRKRGWNIDPLVILTCSQTVYTLLSLLPIMPIFVSFELHCLYLGSIFLICVWNGANFYFEVFVGTYQKRLERFIQNQKIQSLESNSVDVTADKES